MVERLGRYEIEREIGRGGMGVVYRARDQRLGKIVAIKVLTDPEKAGVEASHRFRQEARAAATLSHPAIATAFDYDEQDGMMFIVYEYVEGRTLDQHIAGKKLSAPEFLDIACQVAGGLAYAHQSGILHRDIKPQNIMVGPEGRVKILDFGMAKRTRIALKLTDGESLDTTAVETAAGTIVGTVQYMSPEQIAGEVLDDRTDIFSLGIVLYEMAAGKNPFEGETFGSTVGKILSQEPPPLFSAGAQAPPDLEEVILRCLRKKRDERYASARLLLNDLEALRQPGSGARVTVSGETPAESVIPRTLARASLMLLQILYLSMYGFALYFHQDVHGAISGALAQFMPEHLPGLASAQLWTTVFLTTGCCGIAIRFYFMASVGFDDPETRRQFQKLFPLLLPLDVIWALSPLILVDKWPAGLTLICVTLLAYLPFTHRNLMSSAYPRNPGKGAPLTGR